MNPIPKTARPAIEAFPLLFQKLKNVLTPYARHLTVASDTDRRYTLVGASGKNRAKRFGGVAIRRNQVTFYSCPEILRHGSPRLQAHRSGIAAVGFTKMDQSLVQELATLTAKRFKGYRERGTF